MQNKFIFVSKGRAIIFLIRSIFVIFYLSLTLVISAPPEHLAIYLCMYMAVDIFLFNKMNYLNISVAFNFPWLMVLLFGMLDISTYTKNISTETIHACAVAIFSFSIFSYGKNIENSISITKEVISKQWMSLLLFIFLLFSAFNIISAGYIPFVRMALTGDSGYKDFGISGIYGLFLAFSNALGLVYIYFYFKTKNKKALIGYVTIMLVFALFVTRQNIISLGVETFFIYSIMRGRVSFVKILILSVTVLFLFSIIGGMRSGDIKEIASIRRDFMWIPSAFIWLYSYCYFNILNLDNLVSYPGVPVYDLSSLSGFIPSFIRPDGKSVYILEVSNFNVSSYLSSLYKDMGHMWILVFTITMAIVSKSRVNKFLENANFKNISIAAVLYFCALFSFFVNFWTYLPVIFQIFFILIFDKYTIKNEER